MNVKISAIIPTLNRLGHIKTSLPSILAQTLQPTEVIVVDQSDDQGTKDFFNAFDFGPIRKKYVYQPTKSLILARNSGLRALGDTQFVTFLDDDLVLNPDFFERMIARFEVDLAGEFAGGMGTLTGSEYHPSLLKKIFMLPQDGDGKFLPTGCPTFPHWKKTYTETEFLSGGVTTYRKEIILNNMFDERLVGYGYGDDTDVSYRISRKYKMFYEPKAIATPDLNAPGRDPGTKFRKGWIQNMYYLTEKNIGLNLRSRMLFAWMVLGFVIEDLVHLRRSALKGTLLAVVNILRGKIDSVLGYDEFKASRRA